MNKSLIALTLLATLLLSSLSGCSLVAKDESEWTVEEFYESAKEAYDEEQWDIASKYYEKLIAFYPYGIYAEQSYLELAYCYYRYQEPESAVREMNDFIRTYPKHKELAYAYYLKAISTDSMNTSMFDGWLTDPAKRDMASSKVAFEAYKTIVLKFPESKFANTAKQRLIVIRNRLARHEYLVATYYYKREAYLAAANRAKYILKNYPRTNVNAQAVVLLKESYLKLSMLNTASDVQEVIDHNKSH